MFLQRADIVRPQILAGSLSQMSAGITHKVTKDQHRLMDTRIPKIMILTGDQDDLVNPANSKELAKRMSKAEYIEWKNTAHCLHEQWPQRFNELIERVVKEGRHSFEDRKQNDAA